MKLNDNIMFPYPVKGIADNVISPPIEVEITDESTVSEYIFRINVISLNDEDIQKLIDEIYDGMTDKSGLIDALTTMIAECYNTLLDDNKSGNITWSTVSPTK